MICVYRILSPEAACKAGVSCGDGVGHVKFIAEASSLEQLALAVLRGRHNADLGLTEDSCGSYARKLANMSALKPRQFVWWFTDFWIVLEGNDGD